LRTPFVYWRTFAHIISTSVFFQARFHLVTSNCFCSRRSLMRFISLRSFARQPPPIDPLRILRPHTRHIPSLCLGGGASSGNRWSCSVFISASRKPGFFCVPAIKPWYHDLPFGFLDPGVDLRCVQVEQVNLPSLQAPFHHCCLVDDSE
jgi:hypothetical protein